MTTHTDCVSYEILRREAQASMDPSDPAYEMYSKKKTDEGRRRMKAPERIASAGTMGREGATGRTAIISARTAILKTYQVCVEV